VNGVRTNGPFTLMLEFAVDLDTREVFTPCRRSSIMTRLAGRIVAAPSGPKVGRNQLCPGGSGKKLKKCGAT
jgi:hypothetical protein